MGWQASGNMQAGGCTAGKPLVLVSYMYVALLVACARRASLLPLEKQGCSMRLATSSRLRVAAFMTSAAPILEALARWLHTAFARQRNS
jgi:hypothetical protein